MSEETTHASAQGSQAERMKFRRRGLAVSRLEGFSDAVFAFALTLLVVSLQVPQDFKTLLATLSGFLPFALSFAIFIFLWYQHYAFFRRYGLEDGLTIVLNSALLLVVLFFVFPLKFLFSIAVSDVQLQPEQLGRLFTIYGLGFIAVFLILALLYANAYRQRARLELNSLEAFDTVSDIWSNVSVAAVGLGSIALAQFPATLNLAGFFYFAIAIVRTVYEALSARKRRPLEERFLAAERAPKQHEQQHEQK
ncbi:MAG TPA: TMEM175 family protein [Ktedonobacterales bacterium]|jgi:uncharacterized membrane protein|nr:TMEM175 family protein [Ktedonobacterales bacterium]